MAFGSEESDIAVAVTPTVLNITQFAGDPVAPGPDKLPMVPVGADVEAPEDYLLGLVQDDGSVSVLPNRQFYTTEPGEYTLGIVTLDDADVVFSYQHQLVRVIKNFRRYVVPSDCLVLDFNLPFQREVDGNVPTGRTVVHMLNQTEKAHVEILHPENNVEARSLARFNISWPSSLYCVREILDENNVQFYFDIDPADPGWQEYTANSQTYRFFDIEIPSFDIGFEPLEIHYKRILSPLDKVIVCRVWDRYYPSAVPERMAAMDDGALLDMLVQASKGTSFSGTVRTRGIIGTATGMKEGDPINLVAAPGENKNFTFTAWDTYQAVTFGMAPSMTPVINMSPSCLLSIPVTSAITRKSNGLLGNMLKQKYPITKYHWLTMDLDTRFQLVVLPLAFDPVNIPVTPGMFSVVPVQFFIHDTVAPGENTPCGRPITFEFPTPGTRLKFVAPGLNLASQSHSPKRTWESTADNPLESSTVYTVWIALPDEASHPSEQFLINGEELCTLSFEAMLLNPDDYADRESMFTAVNRFVSLGNFVHMLDAESPAGNALERCTKLVANMSSYYLSVGNAENIRHGGYKMADQTTRCMDIVYWLSQCNWAGCIQENWITAAQTFLDSRGWADPEFLELFDSPVAFEAATQHGIQLGLPFGTATNYFSATPAFEVDRNKVGMLYLVNFFMGWTVVWPYVVDWNGHWRVVLDQLYRAIDPNDMPLNKPDGSPWTLEEWLQAFEDSGPAALLLYRMMESGGPLNAWDVYWVDLAVNTRCQTGLRIDGFNDKPFILNPDHVRAFDPASNNQAAVIDASDFSFVSDYNNVATLALNATEYEAEHMAITGSAQVYVADLKYAGAAGVTDMHGNPMPRGIQKLNPTIRYQYDYQPVDAQGWQPTMTSN